MIFFSSRIFSQYKLKIAPFQFRKQFCDQLVIEISISDILEANPLNMQQKLFKHNINSTLKWV